MKRPFPATLFRLRHKSVDGKKFASQIRLLNRMFSKDVAGLRILDGDHL